MGDDGQYLRGTLPVPAQTASSHLKTWKQPGSLRARAYALAPSYACYRKSAAASIMHKTKPHDDVTLTN